MIKFLLSVFVCVHLLGCLWILLAQMNDYGPSSWIAIADLQDESEFTIYLASIYWAFQTMLTVGYGDINAFSNEEMALCIAWMVLGGFFYTFTIGNLSSFMSNLDTRET